MPKRLDLHKSFLKAGRGLAAIFYVALACLITPALAKEPTFTRIFYRDNSANELRWLDIHDDDQTPKAGESHAVEGFPKLDPAQQGLVQMRYAQGYILVGVRDDNDGEYGSGWILVRTGVGYEDHGDHGHWKYEHAPSVRQSTIDKEQGNPAHLYVYDEVFYLANDARDGFTRLDPAAIPDDGSVSTGFHRGGGGHITLGVSEDRGFASWIDGDGENAGRVDITEIKPAGNEEISQSFFLPTGSIHGGTAAAGKVFLAPRDGVCWVPADVSGNEITPHHISLGDPLDEEESRRAGAFATHRDHVLCVSGSGDDAELAIIDACLDEPTRISLALDGDDGQKPVTPRCVETGPGKHYALIFQDAAEDFADDSDRPEDELLIVDLDPDDDEDFRDAKISKTITVGPSDVEGHSGHHSVAFDANARRAYIANPGDGTLTIVRLDTLEVEATINIGGVPDSIIAVGGRGR